VLPQPVKHRPVEIEQQGADEIAAEIEPVGSRTILFDVEPSAVEQFDHQRFQQRLQAVVDCRICRWM